MDTQIKSCNWIIGPVDEVEKYLSPDRKQITLTDSCFYWGTSKAQIIKQYQMDRDQFEPSTLYAVIRLGLVPAFSEQYVDCLMNAVSGDKCPSVTFQVLEHDTVAL